LHGPFERAQAARGREPRQAAVQAILQWFASGLERFLIAQTPLWYLWGDKRWTRLLRGDPRYARPLASPIAPAVPDASTALIEVG
jgi:hypothetical protein